MRTTSVAGELAALLDLRGSVDLASLVAGVESIPRGPIDTREAAQLEADVREGMEVALGDVRRAFAVLRSPSRAPVADELVDAFGDTGVRGLVDRLWRPLAEVLGRCVDGVRARSRELRGEIAASLRGLGPAPARLEAIDAALVVPRDRAIGRRIAGLTRAVEVTFTKELEASVRAANGALSAPVVEAWLAPNGCYRRGLALAERVALDIGRHERARLEALVEAAVEAARP